MASRELTIEINDLAMRASDDRLSAAQRKRLNDLLESNEDARRASCFAELWKANWPFMPAKRPLRTERSKQLQATRRPMRTRHRSGNHGARARCGFLGWFLRGAIACLVLCAAVLVFQHRPASSQTESCQAGAAARREPEVGAGGEVCRQEYASGRRIYRRGRRGPRKRRGQREHGFRRRIRFESSGRIEVRQG